MLNPEQFQTVEQVYVRFMEGEELAGWDEIDTQLEYLDYLDEEQIFREASVQVIYHESGKVGCNDEFCGQGCFAEIVVEAAEIICELFNNTGQLTPKHRYVLEYYLALSQLKMIVSS